MKYSFNSAPLGWKISTVIWGLLFILYLALLLEKPDHRTGLYISTIFWCGIHFLPLLLRPNFVQIIAKVNFFVYALLVAFQFFYAPWQQAIGFIIAITIYSTYAYYVIYNTNANAYIAFGVNYKDATLDRKQHVKVSKYTDTKKTIKSTWPSDSIKTTPRKKEEDVFKTSSVKETSSKDIQQEKAKPSDLTSIGFKVVKKAKD